MFATLKIVLIRIIAVGAALFAGAMLFWTAPLLHGVFHLSDPTGMFGGTFVIVGMLSNICTIFVFGVLVRHAKLSASLRERVPVPFKIIFFLKAFEAINITPCMVGKPSELCGVSSVFISYMSSPIVIAAAAQIIFRTADRTVRNAGIVMLALFIFVNVLAWAIIAPKNADQCSLMHELADRASCEEHFAIVRQDISICRMIDFRSTRYECVTRIAQMLRKPEMCGEIQKPTDAHVTPWEVPAETARDHCYYILALDLRKPEICAKISDIKPRTVCLEYAQQNRNPDSGPDQVGKGLPPNE